MHSNRSLRVIQKFYLFSKEMGGNLLVAFPQLNTLCEKCPFPEFLWSVFSRIRTEYGEIRSISPYSVRMRENADQKISEYRHFSRSDGVTPFNYLTYIITENSTCFCTLWSLDLEPKRYG